MCAGLSIRVLRSSSAAGSASAATPSWTGTRTQLSTLSAWGWPGWASPPDRKSMWAGHRPLWRSVRLGQPAAPLKHNRTAQRERIPLRELWEYVKYEVKLEEPERCLLAQTLDAFSRIVMGQMHILFEIMDIPESTQENQHALDMYHDVYWYGQYGAKEARDLLFPAIRDFGWNGGYGIASKEVAEDARLAYQLVKALRREYVLPVTNEPIAQIIENPQLM